MSAKQKIYELIASNTLTLPTDAELARHLHLSKHEIASLRELLHTLCREGKLLSDKHYRYGTPEQLGAIKGKISGNERGFGFFMPEDKTLPDLFLPHSALHGALHGDTVYARRVQGRSKDEGEVLTILERGCQEIVGTFYRDKKAGYVIPDERKFSEQIFIPLKKCSNIRPAQKVVAKITDYPAGRMPGGEIVEILGDEDDFFVAEASIIRAHKLRETFPEGVEREAERVSARPIQCGEREDFRDLCIITVDGEDTRDIDDAISLTYDGVYHLGVHIADVSEYVTPRSKLDQEAFARGTSVYFPDRVLPMLPKALSNGCCSLNEGVDRLTLSCLMDIDRAGNVLTRRLTKSVIRSSHRMTYTQVQAIFDGQPDVCAQYPDLTECLAHAKTLTERLEDNRRRRGNVDLDVKEAKIILTDQDEICIPDYARTQAHRMIEQFMVLANEQVASLMTERKVPFLYRVHERPSPEKAEGFLTFLNECGIRAKFSPDHVTPKDYQTILNDLEGQPVFSVINRVMLRSMQKAVYSPVNVGHFGLASPCYCHFTSPIRRYPDLCVHRIVKAVLDGNEDYIKERYGKFVGEAAAQSSETERIATEAERDVDDLYKTQYMADRIGEEYEAVISGVTSFGLFAELPNTVEGLIPIETLPGKDYVFHEEQFLLQGRTLSFRIGERIRIRVVGCDFSIFRVEFGFIEKISK